jgi:predicted transcriptional regulator
MTSKTKKALTGLEWAIAQTVEPPKQPDEFTAEELAKASDGNLNAARSNLARMFEKGLVTKRSVRHAGKRTNLYRKADSLPVRND